MAKIETLTSLSQLSGILAKNAVVIIDFHATWCGPCKAIAPTFESLANKHATPGKVAFTKCDVDAVRDIASQYSIRAMPTFIILKNRSEAARIQGADVRALTTAIEKYAAEGKAAAVTFASSGKGYTLGAAPTPQARKYVSNGKMLDSVPLGAWIYGFFKAVVMFIGLYIMSLLSLDPIVSAENSPFNVEAKPQKPNVRSAGGGSGHMAPGAAGRRMGTLDSIRGDGD